jgi:hypothetical protein
LAREHAVVNLEFADWFKPFDERTHGAPHSFNLD